MSYPHFPVTAPRAMGPGFCDQVAPSNTSKHCARPSGHPGQHRSSLVDDWDTAKWWDDEPQGVLPETPEPPKAPGELRPGDRVADATDDVDNPLRMVGTILRPYVPGEDEEPGYVVQWDRMPEPMDEVATELTPLRTPQSSPAPLLPLSAPVETEGEAESVSEALSPKSETELRLWNLLDKAEQEYLASDEPCDRKSALVRAVLAEGWRPSRTPVPSSQVHVELAKTIAESAGIPPSLAATVASVLIEDEGWRPPLPADEVEWQWGCGSSIDDIFSLDEATAREHAASTGVLRKRRKAGPWVAVPVEPKETK